MVTTARADHRDEDLMRRALDLARRSPAADPNPRVGCVVTDAAGTVVGEGWHQGAGTDHAEVVALRTAADGARGGTAYVTLEPCAHVGRTGPCTDALASAGVARVVHAQSDPHAAAAGGAAALRRRGIEVRPAVLVREATELNSTWTHLMTTGLPWVTWKTATSLDGRVAAADGTSTWITSAESRADVHDRRARAGAVLVGTGTVLTDDPRLTSRRPDGSLHRTQPLRVVVGQRDLPARARVLDDSAPTLHLRTHDPKAVLVDLADRGIHHVWMEGGPTVAAAFVAAHVVDEVIAYVAPVLLGRGPHALADVGVTTMAEAWRLPDPEVTPIGPDVRLAFTLTERP